MSQLRKAKSKGIVAWPEGERPRERLLRQGAQLRKGDAQGFRSELDIVLGRQSETNRTPI